MNIKNNVTKNCYIEFVCRIDFNCHTKFKIARYDAFSHKIFSYKKTKDMRQARNPETAKSSLSLSLCAMLWWLLRTCIYGYITWQLKCVVIWCDKTKSHMCVCVCDICYMMRAFIVCSRIYKDMCYRMYRIA